jgi:hypothetical protein
VAVYFQAPAMPAPLARPYGDIDMATVKGDVRPVTELGYEPARQFNALHIGRLGIDPADQRVVLDRIDVLCARIERQPKSRRWRLRARVGERKRWYEVPDEV